VKAMIPRARWKFGCALASALLLLLVMSCFLSAAAIQRRAVPPPDIDLALGGVRIVGYATPRPSCPPYGGLKPSRAIPCSTESLFPSEEAYTVWLLIERTQAQPGRPRAAPRRLLLLPMR
jgi:hypothetical protein